MGPRCSRSEPCLSHIPNPRASLNIACTHAHARISHPQKYQWHSASSIPRTQVLPLRVTAQSSSQLSLESSGSSRNDLKFLAFGFFSPSFISKIFFLSIFIFHWCIYLAILKVSELNACSIVIILLTERENITDILTILLMHPYLAFAYAKCMHVRKQCRMCPKHKSIIVFAGVLSIALKGSYIWVLFHLLSAISSVWRRIALMYRISCLHTWKTQTFLSVAMHFAPIFSKAI